MSCCVLYHPVLFCLVLSCPVLSCPICADVFCTVVSSLVLLFPTISLSCPTLECPIFASVCSIALRATLFCSYTIYILSCTLLSCLFFSSHTSLVCSNLSSPVFYCIILCSPVLSYSIQSCIFLSCPFPTQSSLMPFAIFYSEGSICLSMTHDIMIVLCLFLSEAVNETWCAWFVCAANWTQLSHHSTSKIIPVPNIGLSLSTTQSGHRNVLLIPWLIQSKENWEEYWKRKACKLCKWVLHQRGGMKMRSSRLHGAYTSFFLAQLWNTLNREKQFQKLTAVVI